MILIAIKAKLAPISSGTLKTRIIVLGKLLQTCFKYFFQTLACGYVSEVSVGTVSIEFPLPYLRAQFPVLA